MIRGTAAAAAVLLFRIYRFACGRQRVALLPVNQHVTKIHAAQRFFDMAFLKMNCLSGRIGEDNVR